MTSTGRAATVFFLSDYGTQDEFVGVVHAVLASAAPDVRVIDLTHHIPAFDVRAGSHALVRASPHLGPGVVLAVVDPGVGSPRRGLCVPVTPPGSGPTCFIGPDNGLLIAAAELVGEAPIARAFALPRREGAAALGPTFDGRDLFAPAAAALSAGRPPEELGDPIDPASLVRLAGALVESGTGASGRRYLRAEVLWVDHFGNVQLSATAADAEAAGLPPSGRITIDGSDVVLRRVDTFDDLATGELGLLIDANGQVAVVAGQAAAVAALHVSAARRWC
jgi:S-adenosylmethionine hydrolase